MGQNCFSLIFFREEFMSTHKVISNFIYSDTCYELTVESNGLEYQPGSCASIMGKSYSFCSSPSDPHLRFIIRKFPEGDISQKLSQLQPGDDLEIKEVFSYFNPGNCSNYCMIATGTGIAPFISALKTYKNLPNTIIYGGKTERDLYMKTFLEKYNSYFCTSQQSHPWYVSIKNGRVTGYLDKLKYDDKTMFYLCGIEGMLADVSNYLYEKCGVDYDRIQTEMFYMSA